MNKLDNLERLSPEFLQQILWPLCVDKCTVFNFGPPETCNVFCEHKFLKKRQERKAVFETASSAVHAISIADSGNLKSSLPPIVVIKGGEFGWGPERFNDSLTKLQYLVTYFMQKSTYTEEGEEIKTHFHDGKFKVKKDHKDYDSWFKLESVVTDFSGSKIVVEPGEFYYIDHQGESNAVKILKLNKGKLTRWLFNPLSYLVIDNDNH